MTLATCLGPQLLSLSNPVIEGLVWCLQTFMMAVEPNNTDLPDPSPGPTDDGYIAVAEKSVPQDPFCCSGPNKDDLGEVLVKPFPTHTSSFWLHSIA